MPTDENNGVVTQNQQVSHSPVNQNPVIQDQQVSPNPVNQNLVIQNQQVNSSPVDQNLGDVSNNNSGDSDDFDFSFSSDNNGDTGNTISQSVQNDVVDQGNANIPEIQNEHVGDVQQTGFDNNSFDTNSQNGNLNTDVINVGDSNSTNVISDEDSFLADIEPEDTAEGTESSDIPEVAFSQDNTQSAEILDKEIQDMISFDEPAGTTANQLESQNSANGDISNGDEDAWLAEEDKKVEETFGKENTGDVSKFSDVNVSSDVVAQNVENLMSEENKTQYVPDEQKYSQMSNLLNSSDVGQVDLDNVGDQTSNMDMGGSTGGTQGMFGSVDVQAEQNAGTFGADNNMEVQQTPTFQPSVDVQNQNMDMGGSTGGTQGMFGSVDVQTEQNAGTFGTNNNMEVQQTPTFQPSVDVQNQNMDMGGSTGGTQGMFGSVDVQAEQNAGTFGADNNMEVQQTPTFQPSVDVQNQNMDMGGSIGGTQGMFGSVDSQGNQEVGTFDISKLDAGSVSDGTQIGLNGLGAMVQDDYGENGVNTSEMEISEPDNSLNLDTIDEDIQNLNVGGQTQQFDSPQNQVQNQQQIPVQNVVAKKGKKQSGFKVIGIFLLVVALLSGLLYGASVMFPDKINLKSIFGGDKIVEYIDNSGLGDNSGLNGIDDQSGVVGEEIPGDEPSDLEGEGGDDSDIDPNSIAALLDGDGDETDSELSGDSTDGEVADIDEPVSETSDSDGNFDPFAQVDELFDENTKNSDALKNYISKGEFYKNLGAEKNNSMISKYGEYIMVTAQGELTKLENGEEIDTTLFSKFDDLLEKVSSLSD